MAEKMKMTRKGYDKLKEQLEFFKTTRREQISEYMGIAIADGDLRESAAYDEARMQQSENEARILDLEDQLENAIIIEEGVQDGVGLGARVLVQDASGREHRFEIVGTYEVDVLNGKISDQSPIGQALAGQQEGSKVSVQMPRGKQEFTILKVSYE
ncbi:transcription elongation factor GreA [Deinococcus sonorensis]|uniref:Transcription elongation factor GreA n=2 Tax=Deinococcus sonorensis TaxID=309891 RepID=A0AAU7UF74_9DEIO